MGRRNKHGLQFFKCYGIMDDLIKLYRRELIRLSVLHSKFNDEGLSAEERDEYISLVDKLNQFLPLTADI